MTRADLIRSVAERFTAPPHTGVVLVGVDGVDGAGKTVFADELAVAITGLGRPVIRSGVDGFHRPRAQRYRRGRHSPEGYFHDSYDYPALRAALLEPLSGNGNRHYRSAVFDHATDRPVRGPVEIAEPDAVLVFDGIFLHRPELAGHWDQSVFLDVPFDVSVRRMAHRDGSDPDPAAAANQRYVLGQRLYLSSCRPAALATAVVDNTDLERPTVSW